MSNTLDRETRKLVARRYRRRRRMPQMRQGRPRSLLRLHSTSSPCSAGRAPRR